MKVENQAKLPSMHAPCSVSFQSLVKIAKNAGRFIVPCWRGFVGPFDDPESPAYYVGEYDAPERVEFEAAMTADERKALTLLWLRMQLRGRSVPNVFKCSAIYAKPLHVFDIVSILGKDAVRLDTKGLSRKPWFKSPAKKERR